MFCGRFAFGFGSGRVAVPACWWQAIAAAHSALKGTTELKVANGINIDSSDVRLFLVLGLYGHACLETVSVKYAFPKAAFCFFSLFSNHSLAPTIHR